MIDIQVIETPLSISACEGFVASPEVGGIVFFMGTVRDKTASKTVLRLEFEAYTPMAIREMRKIAENAQLEYDILKISIHHRIGILNVGEIAVLIAVSAAHRAAAFEACAFCMDRLKETVPIWKKEVFEDGAVWVSAHP